MKAEPAILTGWGRVRRSASVMLRPGSTAEALEAFTGPASPHGLIPHGAARSYGDCALNDEGQALATARLDRIIAFNPVTAMLEAEPGVTFGQALRATLPRGFMLPVTPGTSFATLGGAVANDVHGKNHERASGFCHHVTELDLLTPDGTLHTIGPQRDAELFHATCGGLGLTGLVTRVAVRLAAVPGNALRVRVQRVADLDAFLAALDAARHATYVVGWIDGTASGAALGRGILETAEPAAENLGDKPRRLLRVPVDLPGLALNPLSIRLFNAAYFHRAPAAGRERLVQLDRFFYPLDAVRDWNRLYGRRGFHQFQAVLPFEAGPAALRALQERIVASRRASFLAVLKRLGAQAPGYLSFPQPGYTLALDFPAGPGIEDLYAELVAITLRFGGRVYLAKDALLTAPAFRDMYPRWRSFRDVLERVDPQRRMQSDMSRRLELRL